MILNQADNIMLGSQEVQKVFLGNELIWERNKRQYDETKIAVVLLDENMHETDNITYYDSLDAASTAVKKAQGLYSVFIGKQLGITELGNTVFMDNTNLAKVLIPHGVTKIGICNSPTFGYGPFRNCTSLISVTLPDTVQDIGDSAFHSCYALEHIIIPNGVKRMGYATFAECHNLKEIYLPDSIEVIESSTFVGCKNLSKVRLPANITQIPVTMFRSCYSLAEINLPENIEQIQISAFHSCTNLTKINIPKKVTHIKYWAFRECTSLKKLILPESLVFIGEGAFLDCASLNSINIPNYVKDLGTYSGGLTGYRGVFRNTALTSIVIPSGVRELPSDNFSGCSLLHNITVKNRTSAIENDPWGAPNFISMQTYYNLIEQGKTIPDNKHIVNWAGAGDSEEDEIVRAQNAFMNEIDSDGVTITYMISRTFAGIKNILQENPAKNYDIVLGEVFNFEGFDHVYDIPADCFSGFTNIKSIYIPQKFNTIAENAFSGCTELQYIEIGRPKGEIAGEPWGAPAGTLIYYSAQLATETGDILTGNAFFTARTTENESIFNTNISGILRTDSEPEEPVFKLLYVVTESGKFSLKLGDKGLRKGESV